LVQCNWLTSCIKRPNCLAIPAMVIFTFKVLLPRLAASEN
jgi:hypothetical protein